MPGLTKKTALFTSDAPLTLACGATLPEFTLAYETYGEMNAEKDNVILLFHALTGSQNAAGKTTSIGVPDADSRWTDECQTGWWDSFIGPGLAIDTDQFFVVCANYLGGCYGSTGPSSLAPSGQPYGSQFPRIAMRDIVESQVHLLDYLAVKQVHAAIGNSIGGMLALEFATRYADRTRLVLPVATSMSSGSLHRLMNFEQILAIESDPHFNGGDYYTQDHPNRGLALARMISHKTFIHIDMLERRARDEMSDTNDALSWYPLSRSLESYMLHQGQKFTSRFDANTYLRLIDAWQQFDLLADSGHPNHAALFAPCKDQRYLIFSIDSDVCFYPDDQSEIAHALHASNIPAMHVTVHSEKGHDSFLLEPELYAPHISYFLNGKATTNLAK